MIFLCPHQSTDLEIGLKISCCGKPDISVSYAKLSFSESAETSKKASGGNWPIGTSKLSEWNVRSTNRLPWLWLP
jgi:hypothetical protein